MDTFFTQNWNIFARELEAVVALRGFSLARLGHWMIHPQKACRLQASLHTPKSFPILNPDELTALQTSLALTSEEMHRLQAALLATAIERVLMDRLSPDQALQATQHIFMILLHTFQRSPLSTLSHSDRSDPPLWNIFARELQDILAAQSIRITQLDDRTSIHTEKVRRLRKSLHFPKSLPTLNTDELDDVISIFDLRPDEVLRLQAALLATAIERTLMDRMPSFQALSQADTLFSILLRALLQDASTDGVLCRFLGIPTVPTTSNTTSDQPLSSPSDRSFLDSRKTAPLDEQATSHIDVPDQEPELHIEAVIAAWLQVCASRTQSQATVATYEERIHQFRAYVRQHGYDLLSDPLAIAQHAPLWAVTRSPKLWHLGPLCSTTVHQRLAVLSSFYQFVCTTQCSSRFTANPIPIHMAAQRYRCSHPLVQPVDASSATAILAQLPDTTSQDLRDYALLWIALTSAHSPCNLVDMRVGYLCLDEAQQLSLIWPQRNPRIRPAVIPLPLRVSQALQIYLFEVYSQPLQALTSDLPLWVSFSKRKPRYAISTQTFADIARKHLGFSSLRAFLQTTTTN